MALLRLGLSGSSHRFHSDATSGVVEQTGILGVDIAHKTVGTEYYTVVQLLLDDMRPDGDRSILTEPLVAEITRPSEVDDEPQIVASALFDHDEFRRRLKDEQDAGVKETRGVLVLDNGALPEPWTRFAFVPFSIRLTAGMDLRIYRTTVGELNAKVEDAFAHGRINEEQRRNMLLSIEQHHPGKPASGPV